MKITRVKKIDNVDMDKYNNIKNQGIIRRKILKSGFEQIVITSDKDAD